MDDKEYLEEIKNNLSIEQIEILLAELGGEPQKQGNIIKSKTICHCGNSHKLYYYDNTKLFKCYTDCSDTWDIFQLLIKIKEWNLPKALDFILDFYNLPKRNNSGFIKKELEDWNIIRKYEKNIYEVEKEKQTVEVKFYDDKILKYLPRPRILIWEKEGITKEVINHCGICYDPSAQGIVIPHYNEDSKLVGIRERTLIKENEVDGKYKPALINGQMYNHPLGFNLYNLNNSKNMISQMKKVIVFEGEKSCLLYESYFGIDNDISVAVCGSNLINYQFQLLKSLGVEEICIAFDKQFKEIGDDEWKSWTKKLKEIYKKYGNEIKISFLFDKWNLLGYKMSPIDNGKDVFLELFKRRVSL